MIIFCITCKIVQIMFLIFNIYFFFKVRLKIIFIDITQQTFSRPALRWRRSIDFVSRRDFNSTVFRHDNIRGNTISKNTYLTEKTLSRIISSTYCCVEMKISSHVGTFISCLINVGQAGWFDVYLRGWNDQHHFHSIGINYFVSTLFRQHINAHKC